jgi:hypothetical protein
MRVASCLDSLSCLEGWQHFFQSVLLAGGIIGTVLGIGLYFISNRISDLKADRTFTVEQSRIISKKLLGKPPANFRIMAYSPSGDSTEYSGKLERLLNIAS